jgi:transposase InsO family protein
MISTQDRQHAVKLIIEAKTQGARLKPACRLLGISKRTYQRWTREGAIREDQRPLALRPTPANALTADEQREILTQCHRPEFADLPPEQIVVRLMDEEQRYLASASSFYRVLRKHGEVTQRGRAKPRQRHTPPTTHHASLPNQVWSWDCTWLPGPAKGTFYYLLMIVDIFSRKVVGWEVFLSESAANACLVIERAVLAERIINQPLVLHADNGSPFKAATLLEKLYDLNIATSFSRPRVSNDNAYSEALFRTCKYVPNYPHKGFSDLTIARQWVHGFVQWYNHEHRHSAIKFVTPLQRHCGEDVKILAQRKAITEAARKAKPGRWSGDIRNWERLEIVSLNPARDKEISRLKQAA